MHCTLCRAPGISFTRAVHPRHGIIYLCGACRRREQASLPADAVDDELAAFGADIDRIYDERTGHPDSRL